VAGEIRGADRAGSYRRAHPSDRAGERRTAHPRAGKSIGRPTGVLEASLRRRRATPQGRARLRAPATPRPAGVGLTTDEPARHRPDRPDRALFWSIIGVLIFPRWTRAAMAGPSPLPLPVSLAPAPPSSSHRGTR
jgi:hypothetical protein